MPRPHALIPLPDDPLWYKDAIIYQLHVRAFFDSNNDGVGDFPGLTAKLDYVQELGVNAIWLLPFYPSPLRDDGYDIGDYFDVHPSYGNLRDVRQFVREAHKRGLRVITELVINHTSDQHPWFQAARAAPKGSRKRDYYVWSDTYKKYEGTRIIFTDTETSNWTWDNVAQQYYWHRFFSHQPDLNFDNPNVLKAVIRVMRFWLDMGVNGLRLDAIPYLCEREGTNNENLPETHAVLRRIRAALDARYRNRMLLAEANQWPEDVRPYFGDGDECHMAFHFPLMPRIFMAVAQEDRHPVVEIMDQTPDIPPNCQWAIFLRNHDELTLEMVTDSERDYMYQVYAHDPRMRVNLGIRRRLASLVDNDIDRIRLLNNLLLSMPGSPIVYYGDEIGMGDNIYVGDRNGVRTPMQWSPDRNGGFSRADPARLYLPPVMDAVYGYEAVNVEAQSRDPFSLLNWMKRLIAVRTAHKAFGRGDLRFLRPGNRKVLAFLRQYDGETILCVTNLSRAAQPVELDLAAFKGRVPVELLGRTAFPPIGELTYLLTIPGYGFYWFRLATDVETPSWHAEHTPVAELPLLVLFAGFDTLFPATLDGHDASSRAFAQRQTMQFTHEILPRYVASQRWFGAKGGAIARVDIVERAEWTGGAQPWLFAAIQAYGEGVDDTRYVLPLAIAWEGRTRAAQPLVTTGLARVRRGARLGVLRDALLDVDFCAALLEGMRQDLRLPFAGGVIEFHATGAFARIVGDARPVDARALGADQSNSSVVLDERLVLKTYRRWAEGINPELEMGRFLTEVSPFPHAAPVAGYLQYRGADDRVAALTLLQPYIVNQGDGWTYTLGYLERYLENCRVRGGPQRLQDEAGAAIYMHLARRLGERTGELHAALARAAGDPAFEPEPAGIDEIAAWVAAVGDDARTSFDLLARRQVGLPEVARASAEELLARADEVFARLHAVQAAAAPTVKMRYHGDYHLGQVLVVENDFVIVDFEGEPARPLATRRAKHSPLRDVAGMLRSFNYAGHAAIQRVTAETPTDYAACEMPVGEWERAVRRTFLDGYRVSAPAALGFPPQGEPPLLHLFTIEKALYELRYELDNRPEWVAIPLRGLLHELRAEPGS